MARKTPGVRPASPATSAKRSGRAVAKPGPRTAGVLPRARLFASLAAQRGGGVWVGAPAGYGKTILAASFVEQARTTPIWMRAEPGDADPATFFTRLRAAVVRSHLAPASSLPPFRAEHYAAVARFARRFFHALFAAVPHDTIVVLDELECLGDAAAPLLTAALHEIRSERLLLCLSRTPLPDALARAHVGGALAVITADSLAMTAGETLELAQLHGTTATRARAEEVHRLTRGWPAAVAWFARSADALPSGAMPPLLSAYVGAEIYGAFDDEARRLLLHAAFVPDISPGVERHWPALAGATRLAGEAAERGLLVTRESADSYRLHPLFSEFLRDQAGREWGAEAVVAVRRAAAGALLAAGRADAALTIFLELGAYAEAASVLVEMAPALFREARLVQLQHWLLAIPPDARTARPELAYWLGLSRLTDSPAAAQRDLLAAYGGFRARTDRPWLLRTLGLLAYSTFLSHLPERPLRAWLAELRDLDVEWGRLASPEEQAELAIAISYPLFICEPASADVPLWEDRLLRALHAPIEAALKARVAVILGAHYGLNFNPHRMIVLHDWLAPALARQGLSEFGEIVFTMIRLQEAIARADYDRAERTLEEALARAEGCGIRFLETHHRVIVCHGRLARGDLDGAAQMLAAVRAAQQAPQPFDAWHAEILSAWLALERGEPQAALGHANLAYAAAALLDAPDCLAYAQAARCFCHLATGDRPALEAALQALGDLLPRGRSQLARLMADGIEAIVAARSNDDARREAALRRAMAIVRGYDFDRLPLLTTAFVGELALLALEADVAVEYAQRLVRAYRVPPPANRPAPDGWPWPVAVRAFGSLQVSLAGSPLPQARRTQRQPLVLLAVLVASGGRDVSLTEMAERLHPRVRADSALARLEVTLHRLRRLLATPDALVVRGGRVSLNPQVCDLDVWRLERRLRALEALVAAAAPPDEIGRAAEAVAAAYTAPLLEEYDEPFVRQRRIHLQTEVRRALESAVTFLRARGSLTDALERASARLATAPV